MFNIYWLFVHRDIPNISLVYLLFALWFTSYFDVQTVFFDVSVARRR